MAKRWPILLLKRCVAEFAKYLVPQFPQLSVFFRSETENLAVKERMQKAQSGISGFSKSTWNKSWGQQVRGNESTREQSNAGRRKLTYDDDRQWLDPTLGLWSGR